VSCQFTASSKGGLAINGSETGTGTLLAMLAHQRSGLISNSHARPGETLEVSGRVAIGFNEQLATINGHNKWYG